MTYMILFMILIGIGFIIFGSRSLLKPNENSFSDSLKDKNRSITDFDIKLGELRREFSETVLELQQEIQELKENSSSDFQLEASPRQKSVNLEGKMGKKKSEEDKAVISNNSIKVNEISTLLKQGLTLEEISEKLNINKGEVLLIKELYIR